MRRDAGEDMPLAAGFPSADRERWMEQVDRVLTRGRDGAGEDEVRALFARVLQTPTYDGITLEPLYTAGDAPEPGAEGLPGLAPFVRGALPRSHGGGWDVRQVVRVEGDGGAAAGRALHELENGATSVLVDLRAAATIDVALLDRVLEGVRLEAAAVGLDAGPRTPEAAEALRGLWAERGVDDAAAAASLGADPIGDHASTGGADGPVADALARAIGLAGTTAARHPGVRALMVDARRYHDAGASDAQQLGCAVATGVAYLRALTEAGLPLPDACGQIEFRLAATAQQFPTIASLRAARRLWARVAEVSAVPGPARGARLHAVSSRAMTTRYDPWGNLLRDTVACFAAGVGGAEVVTIEPFDVSTGAQPRALGRRLARNTQTLLIDESALGRVADPAGGSWFVERLTDELARAAWAWFQEIERAGGIVAALDAGLVQERIGATWEARLRNLARRRDPVTGVTEFPDIDEAPPPPPAPATHVRTPIPALVPRRYAQPFEDQRARADRHAAESGERPRVFLATLGTPAVHTARATFAKNLFESAGIRALAAGDIAAGDDAGAAFAASGAALACICSSDAVYAEQAAEVARALADAGATRVYLAGRPGDREDALREAGVDAFAYAGCDVLALLTGALDAAGVAA